jgi:hypothetical protein
MKSLYMQYIVDEIYARSIFFKSFVWYPLPLCHFCANFGVGLAPNKLNSSSSSTGTYPLLFPPPPPLRLLVIVFPFKVTLTSSIRPFSYSVLTISRLVTLHIAYPHLLGEYMRTTSIPTPHCGLSDVLPSWQMGFHPFPNFQVHCIDPLSAIPAHTVEPIIISSTVYGTTRQGSQQVLAMARANMF